MRAITFIGLLLLVIIFLQCCSPTTVRQGNSLDEFTVFFISDTTYIQGDKMIFLGYINLFYKGDLLYTDPTGFYIDLGNLENQEIEGDKRL